MKSDAIKIVLYEDNDALRNGMSVLLGGSFGFEFLGAFENTVNVENQVKMLRPDVVLMDIDMPIANGFHGLRIIREKFPETIVLMLTVFEENDYIFEAICLGAVGYLLKTMPPAELLKAIQDAYAGGSPMSSSIARKVLTLFYKSHEKNPNNYALTEREKDILTALVNGNSYKMIAALSNIAIDTVRSHIKKIYEKLQVHSQTEAVSKAIHEKLV